MTAAAADNWRTHAACKGAPVAVFYPEQRGGYDPYRTARTYCTTCPVRDHCLQAALDEETNSGELHGMRGGATPDQRYALIAGKPRHPQRTNLNREWEHGLPGGISRHWREGSTPCTACKIAEADRYAAYVRNRAERRARARAGRAA